MISLIVFIHESLAQNRRFYRKRHNQNNRNHFGHSHQNYYHPQFQHFYRNQHVQHQEPLVEPIILASSCPQIDFLRALDNRWYGSFNYIPIRSSDQKGIKIEIEFNDVVIGFVVRQNLLKL